MSAREVLAGSEEWEIEVLLTQRAAEIRAREEAAEGG